VTVGVFADQAPVDIAHVQKAVGLDAVQLHGRGGPSVEAIRRVLPAGVLVIRAVPVAPEEDDPSAVRERVERETAGADLVVLDTAVKGGFGGTGTVFRWRLARDLAGVLYSGAGGEGGTAGGKRFLVAGGINPDNVQQALSQSGAWGVDVSSGVEVAPGVKDPRAIRELFERVNQVRSMGGDTADARVEGLET
jgi:phosphoribosylanthranilate isomerase